MAACAPPPPGGCAGIACSVSLGECSSADTGVEAKQETRALRPARKQRPPLLQYVPTCEGNSAESSPDGTCAVAASACPRQQDTRYWVYVREWQGTSYGEPQLRQQPLYVCLGPGDVRDVDPRLQVIERVRRDWRDFGLPGAMVVTQPRGETLVNAATRFRTTTPPTATLPPRPVLGMDVTLRIKATRYAWDFGDGTVQEADAEGGKPRAEHTYRDPGVKRVRLRTFYSATFTIAGDATVYPLEGTADVPGRATRVTAREARTELIDG